MSHAQQIRDTLESGGTLTASQAWRDLGCMRLAARVNELREDGVPICTEMIYVRGRDGKARVARYSI